VVECCNIGCILCGVQHCPLHIVDSLLGIGIMAALASQSLEIQFLPINCMWPSKLGTVSNFDSCSCEVSTFRRVVTVHNQKENIFWER